MSPIRMSHQRETENGSTKDSSAVNLKESILGTCPSIKYQPVQNSAISSAETQHDLNVFILNFSMTELLMFCIFKLSRIICLVNN